MLLRSMVVQYQCTKCDAYLKIERMSGDLKGIFAVLEGVDKNKLCQLCTAKMDIISISSKVMQDMFGNENFGFWMCSDHDSKRYYPNPLKKSTTDKSMANFGKMGPAYVIITDNKFPWKCPICTNVLKYTDERHAINIC